MRLVTRDYQLLKTIYDLRCLTFEQIKDLFFLTDNVKESSARVACFSRIRQLIADGYIVKKVYSGTVCYFLTNKGVNTIVKYFNFPANIKKNKNVIERSYFRAHELLFKSDILFQHQTALNQVYVYLKKHLKGEWTYVDSKHHNSRSSNEVRPDALLKYNNIEFYLEMDLSTESLKTVYKKWLNYSRHISFAGVNGDLTKRVILFMVNNFNDRRRIQELRKSVIDLLGPLSIYNFDLFIDTTETILDFLINYLPSYINYSLPWDFHKLLNHKGFSVENIKTDINNFPLHYVFMKEIGKNAPKKVGDRYHEFFCEFLLFDHLQADKRIKEYPEVHRQYIYPKFKRNIPLVVVCKNKTQLSEIHSRIQPNFENVLFTTLELLKNKTYPGFLLEFNRVGEANLS